ncbi:PrkA [Paenibacillus mucilaginosus 3016]|uniref:PrkA n=2 Tax=Paenibacillus mucilaginosus TaxID=61624 RepID=H6NK66_9BACL|nr:protein PrkA [Paenibacillus mucilaginosus]AFC31550.1 PrkA [Paenibacillus mucilaginosus 3016]AFH63895.1 protein prkA [Paenibacillus mucilaginosus K02]WFA20089.1 protein prkA [Paenibacillus mucilaginosus]
MVFLDKLADFRVKEQGLHWEGTFVQYLEKVRERPEIAGLAHDRIYRMIEAAGIEEKEDGRREYKFFSSELFGLEDDLQTLVEEYFRPAAQRLDVRKRLLLLMGPVSGGKSTLVALLKQGLEKFSRTEAGAVYAIAGCPMQEEPLHLVPMELREDFRREFGMKVEGELCPVCRMRLETEYGGRAELMPVKRVLFSEVNRSGIGTFAPSDPKSQDIADLTGSIDFSTITQYGSESDPRAYRFDGELNKANRGLMEFQEMLKCDEKFLWNLLSLTQEGNFKAGRFALISADELIVAHTNETEYRTFIANKKNEALHSRMIVMRIPYNLKVTQEEKIYRKLIGQSNIHGVHIAPGALWTSAVFSVLSRLKESKKPGMDPLKKMYLYDGTEVEGTKNGDLQELRREFTDEGMSGVDPRYVINRISSALLKGDKSCINALDVLKSLKEGLDQHASITKEERERLLNFINLARKEFDHKARTEVQRAFVYSFEESAHTVMNNYLDNVEAYCNGFKLRDPITEEEREPDEKLMRSIEEGIGVTENQKRAFREEILIKISSLARRGKRFEYTSHERLKEAIEKKLFEDLRDVVKITTSAKTPDENQLKRINEVSGRLIEHHGYCAVCANELLKYVGSLLNR